MKKSTVNKLAALLAVLALAVFMAAACSSPEVSRSSSAAMVVEEPGTSSSAASSSVAKKSLDPVYVLAIGNDSRYHTSEDTGVAEDSSTYSDTIMVMRLDPAKNVISILSIPRDTATTIDGTPYKINDLHWFKGAEGLAAGLGDMLGVKIPYYLDMKFVDFAAFVDAFGGFYVNVPKGLTGGDIINGNDITLEAGDNTLDGVSALMLARQRKVYGGNGEAVRQMISRDMVANAIQKVAAMPASDSGTYTKLIESFGSTNMSSEVAESYIKAFMENPEPITFYLGTAPYEGGVDETGKWRAPYDPDTYAQLRDLMENEQPLDLVPLPPVY